MTVEDPIEYYMDGVGQTQVNTKVEMTFARGLRAILRQDPDVVMIGEIRDLETAQIAVQASQTGHLVLSTLHTLDATETITRIVSVFPPHHQGQIRLQLSRVLRAAVAQRLLPRADGTGRALAAEVMVGSPFIKDAIAEREKTSLIPGAIAAGGSEYGMQTFDQSILQLCKSQTVTVEEALRWVTNVDEFSMRLRGITPGSRG